MAGADVGGHGVGLVGIDAAVAPLQCRDELVGGVLGLLQRHRLALQVADLFVAQHLLLQGIGDEDASAPPEEPMLARKSRLFSCNTPMTVNLRVPMRNSSPMGVTPGPNRS